MKSNFPKIPFSFFLIFCILSCFIFFFFYRAINNNNITSQLVENEWQSEALKRDEIKTLDDSIKIIKDERDQLGTHFAQSSDVVPFLSTIGGLATKAGTKAIVTSVDIPVDNSGLLVGMKASGTFNNLYKFLTLLENSPYEIEFSSVDLQKENVAQNNTGSKVVSTSSWTINIDMRLLSFIP